MFCQVADGAENMANFLMLSYKCQRNLNLWKEVNRDKDRQIDRGMGRHMTDFHFKKKT